MLGREQQRGGRDLLFRPGQFACASGANIGGRYNHILLSFSLTYTDFLQAIVFIIVIVPTVSN